MPQFFFKIFIHIFYVCNTTYFTREKKEHIYGMRALMANQIVWMFTVLLTNKKCTIFLYINIYAGLLLLFISYFCLFVWQRFNNLPCHCERFHSHHVYIHEIEREKPIYFFAKSCVWHRDRNKCLHPVNRSVGILRCVAGLTTVYQTPVDFIDRTERRERERER